MVDDPAAAPSEEDIPGIPGLVADYIKRNWALWEKSAPHHAAGGRRAWQDEELRWGLWDTPDSRLQIAEGFQSGTDVVELGCGAAAISAGLARRGLRPVAVDISGAQLDVARRLQEEFDLWFPLLHANAEEVPFDDASFDLAVSEYGASLWCNPRRWLPEASRLLRPGGQLVFFTNGAMLMAATPFDGGPADRTLVRDYFSRYRVEFAADGGVEFHLTHGHWIKLLRTCGFVLDSLIEVRPPPDAKARFDFVGVEWARRWPSEEIWIARKTA